MNSEFIDQLIEKQPALEKSRQKLEAMQAGAYCLHRSWGFGQIQSFDETHGKLLINFDGGQQGHAMDPVFCLDKLEILPENSVLVAQQKDPEEINTLIKKQPVDLVVKILEQAPKNSLTNTEIERLLSFLLGASKYKKWWTSTKKALIKDPRVATPSKKDSHYILRQDPLSPEQEILEDFYLNKQPKKKILLAEKLYQLSSSVDEIKQDLPQILDALTEVIKETRILSQADRLHGCWVRNDLARHLHSDVESLEPTSASIIKETADLSELALELPYTYFKRFLDLISRTFTDNWLKLSLQLLKNSTGKFTHECINFLIERDSYEHVTTSLLKWLDEQTIKGPVLFWIIKNRQAKRFEQMIAPLMKPRLLNAIFFAIDSEALQSTSNKRIPLADLVTEDHDLIATLLDSSSVETAKDLAQMLLINQGFEDLSKKSILARFIKKFPSIQSLVSGDQVSTEKHLDELVVSQESLDARKREYEILITKKIPENNEAIAVAREHGDLRENAEYKMAREDQATLLARKGELELELSKARITTFGDATTEAVGIGSIVELKHEASGNIYQYAILGAWDSYPEENILSYKTPLGQSLLAKGVGETVETIIDNNKEAWTIQKISRWLDDTRSNSLLKKQHASKEAIGV